MNADFEVCPVGTMARLKALEEWFAEFDEEWPGGLSEIEASVNGWRSMAKKLESEIEAKFVSGNNIPVERITITRKEFNEWKRTYWG